MGRKLIETLQTFRVEGSIAGRTVGPVVTQDEVAPGPGVKVGRSAALADDLALAMRAQWLRIVAPIPGKAAVGIEVPNPMPRMVHVRELIEGEEFHRGTRLLPISIGKNLEGEPVVADLAKMPHLLIAGATGSGKSVCINTIITSLLYRYPPKELRMLLIDPKMVELSMYNALPHLRHPVVTNNQKAATALKWAVRKMERHYRPHQGELFLPHRIPRRIESGQPHHPRPKRRGDVAGKRRHAVPPPRQKRAGPHPGLLHLDGRDRALDGVVHRAPRPTGPAGRSGHHRADGAARGRGESRRRERGTGGGRRSARSAVSPGRRSVRPEPDRLDVAAATAHEYRVRPGRPHHRSAGAGRDPRARERQQAARRAHRARRPGRNLRRLIRFKVALGITGLLPQTHKTEKTPNLRSRCTCFTMVSVASSLQMQRGCYPSVLL